MTKSQTKKLKEITDKIVKEYKPEKIILFGSWAWGKPGPDSDVDLFIVKQSADRRIDRARTVRKIIWDIIWNAGLAIDILVYTPKEVSRRLNLEDFFVEDIINKGQVLYSLQ